MGAIEMKARIKSIVKAYADAQKVFIKDNPNMQDNAKKGYSSILDIEVNEINNFLDNCGK